jgi:3-dehydroquinate dehydratase
MELTNRLSMENALLFEQEAITPYEKALARYLVASMQREAKLQYALRLVSNSDVYSSTHIRHAVKDALDSCEYPVVENNSK